MQIDRVEDKKFQLTLTDDEADKLSDHTEIDFHRHRLIANRIGSRLLGYMSESCKFPHSKRATLDLELFNDGP
ncbi:hypothetical protein ES703_105755 [subsurface metagenome]